MRYLLILSLLISNSVWASCPEAVQLVQKDEVVNCTGYLYSPAADEAANDAYDKMTHLEKVNPLLKERAELVEERNRILEQRLHLHIQQSEIFAKQLVKKENQSFWQKTVYFGLGILATGMAVHAAKGL